MANALGYVSETKTGFEGALAMMNLTSPIRIEKNAEKAAEGQPDYRIFAGEDLDRNRRRLDAQGESFWQEIPLDHARRSADRTPQDLRKPRPGQRQKGTPRDPLEPPRLAGKS